MADHTAEIDRAAMLRERLRQALPEEHFPSGNVAFLLAKCLQRAHAVSRPVLEPLGITPQQMVLMLALLEADGLAQAEIAERLGVDRTTTMQMIDRLERNGIVARRRDPQDRRVQRVYLTERALEHTAAIAPRLSALRQQFLEPLDVSEREELVRLLRKLLGANGGKGDVS